jgi:eukaryotic-like serine/threonine-protein kinase
LIYVATEMIEAKNLEEIIANTSMNLKQILDIIYQISLVLSYTQGKNVVHGDLKPSNILITEQGQVKLNNFCICKDLYTYSIDSIGFYKGQLDYMAPEKLEKKPIDFRADLFSLGIIFYRLLTGDLPFEGETPYMLLESQHYKEINLFNTEIPEQIKEIVLNLLQRELSHRVKSAEQLMKRLKGIKDNL